MDPTIGTRLEQFSRDLYVLTTVVAELAKDKEFDPYIKQSFNALTERADKSLKRMRATSAALEEFEALKSRMDELLADNPNLLTKHSEGKKLPFIANPRA